MKKVFVVLFILAGFALLFHSCQEEIVNEFDHVESENELSSVEQRFLGLTRLKSGFETTGELFVREVCSDLEKQNKKNRFVHKFVEKYGFPDWDLVRWFDVNNESVAQVPLYKENDDETGAIILVVKNKDKLKFKLLLRDNFGQFVKNRKPVPDVEKIRDLFIIFDFLKFGKSSYLPAGQLTFSSDDSTTMILKSGDLVENTYCYYMEVRYPEYGEVYGKWECESWWVYSPITEEQVGDQSSGGNVDYSDWYYETPDAGGGGGESTVSSPEVIIDPTFEDTKAECVKLKLENGSILNTLLAGFDLDQSLIDVTYKVGNLTGANGECFLNGRRIDITIDQDRLNATSMELANTILHETFHAYIYGKLYNSELHTGLCPEPNFGDDFEAYKQQFGDQSQHNYMANKYIEYMRSGLQDYFGGESYRTTFLNYVGDMTQWYGEQNLMECLSWSGLKGTVAWSEYYGNQTNKTRYDETMQFIIPLLSGENCNN